MQEILNVNDEKILINFEKFLKNIIHKSGKEISPMTIEELNDRIDRSEKDFIEDRYTDIDKLSAKYEQEI